MKEADIQRHCQQVASQCGARLFRNNIGSYEKDGYHVKYGVCNPGGSDLIGLTAKGRFLAVEIKQPGKNSTVEQKNFIEMVNKFGGLAGVCRSGADMRKLLDDELNS